LVERYIAKRGGPVGVVATATVTFYGAARYFDEHVLLTHGPGGVAVEGASLAFVAVGLGFMGYLLWRWRRLHPSALSVTDGTVVAPPDPWAPAGGVRSAPEPDQTRDRDEPSESDATESISANNTSPADDVPMIRAGNDTTT
jgi:hypothetical protein